MKTIPYGLHGVDPEDIDAVCTVLKGEWLTLHHNLDRFRISEVNNERDLSSMRWTVDTPEDFDFVNKIY